MIAMIARIGDDLITHYTITVNSSKWYFQVSPNRSLGGGRIISIYLILKNHLIVLLVPEMDEIDSPYRL